ncbi:molybdopterin-binding protein [Rhodobacter sp. NTK016B]|uniref:molybdopterin-binding protein n=1 Tax=Rhodobacter sp. NTK016B TaxID=2759676 RepID=UPI001A9093A8|nr:molybdopterin-binding protein [Rhodobacter sp. NTK016B]MBN8291473.1 molybdopterin-binding protein [Rhodobacter sp. NTK016B]
MDFGPVPLDQALGVVLAHSVPLTKGRLKKGKVLEQGDLDALAATGLQQVIAARLSPGDTDEDDAALTLARSLVRGADGLELQAVGTGRVNVLATGPGLARINAAKVDAVNAADPAITLATVPRWHRMDPGGMVATVKIIAYGVEKKNLHAAAAQAEGGLSLAQPVIRNAVMIETVVGKGLGDKGHRVTQERLRRLDVNLGPEALVAHEENALAEAITKAEGEMILILTASATSDIRDVAPSALRRAGGTVEHFGMPVDPGNLLFLGQLDGCPVVGLPGCARSPALNGADWVLERLICGVPISGADIRAMGVGGLLKEIPTRPRPRDRRE